MHVMKWYHSKFSDIKKRWQEYKQKLYKDLHDPEKLCDGVIYHLEQDPRLKSQVGLGSITMNKVTGGDGIPVELLKS